MCERKRKMYFFLSLSMSPMGFVPHLPLHREDEEREEVCCSCPRLSQILKVALFDGERFLVDVLIPELLLMLIC